MVHFVDSIHPIELEIKDSTDTDRSDSSDSYLDLYLEIDWHQSINKKTDVFHHHHENWIQMIADING